MEKPSQAVKEVMRMCKQIQKEFLFPFSGKEMAKLRFEVELSDAKDIKWEETLQGLLSFFALCSHETYFELAKTLERKVTG